MTAEIYPYELKRKHRAKLDAISDKALEERREVEQMLNEAYWAGVTEGRRQMEGGGDAA